MENKKELIKEKNLKIDEIEKQISSLENEKYELSKELEKLYAPEKPTDMVGKYLKQVDKDGEIRHWVRVDDVNTVGDADPEYCMIRFCGFGFSKNLRGHLYVTNREIIAIRPNSDYKNQDSVIEITKEEFDKVLTDIMLDVTEPLNWEEEFA